MNLDRMTATATRLVEERHLPGLVVGVATSDGTAFARGFGYADIESHRAQSPSIRHRIGSVTKTMTALCVMALVDEKRLSLDDRVATLLPELDLRGHGDKLSVRHLLAHIGGVGEVPTKNQLPPGTDVLHSAQRQSVSMLQRYPDGIEIEVPPGTKWCYANHGYGLLAEIVTTIESASLNDAMQARIFDPLRMDNSDVLDHLHPDLSRGYLRTADDDQSVTPIEEFLHIRGDSLRGAGAGQSTMDDMTRYASALLRGGAGIIRPETLALMFEPGWCPDPRLASQGLGIRRTERFGRPALIHKGGIQGGWITMLTILPADNLALVTFVNLVSADFGPVDSALLQALLDAPEQIVPDITINDTIFAAAPGTYQCTPGALTNLRVSFNQGRVFIEQREQNLYVRAQRGAWSEGIRILPADASDPTLFALDGDDIEPTYIALDIGTDGRVRAIRTSDITELVRAPDR